jgi:tRNA(Ile)-lysidine synthase TilS/MesJ
MHKDQFTPHFDKKTARLFDMISRRTGKAIMDYHMIQEGDKVLVGVSGGKDSLTLWNVMLHRQTIAPIDFEILAIHIDNGLPGADIPKLAAYARSLGLPFQVVKARLFKDDKPEDLNCFWCSWNRRKALFHFAQKNGFRKIALAHHMDDIVETALLNQVFKGEISAMNPRQDMFDGKVIPDFSPEKSAPSGNEGPRGQTRLEFGRLCGVSQILQLLKTVRAKNPGLPRKAGKSLSDLPHDPCGANFADAKFGIAIIRPLCYEREETIIRFTKSAGLASFETCRCPVSALTQRSAMKKFLKEMEKVSPAAVPNVFNSLKNIKEEYLP